MSSISRERKIKKKKENKFWKSKHYTRVIRPSWVHEEIGSWLLYSTWKKSQISRWNIFLCNSEIKFLFKKMKQGGEKNEAITVV